MANLTGKLTRFLGSSGSDADTDTLWTTPWAWRDDDACYVGWNGQVWLYRSFPLSPIASQFEDADTRLMLGRALDQLLLELGDTSREGLPGISATAQHREVHIVAVSWESEARPFEGSPERLRSYLTDSMGFLVPTKGLLIGVQLRAKSDVAVKSFLDGMKQVVTSVLGEQVPDLERYNADRTLVDGVFMRAGCRRPTAEELRQLESWYNLGRGPDAFIIEHREHIEIEGIDRIEIASLLEFNRTISYAPNYQWVEAAETHPEGVRHISIRAELQPATAARRRTRQSQRRIRSQIEEEMATGDIERPEYSDTFQLAAAVEDHFLNTQEPLLTKCSVLLSRRVAEADETYVDYLRNYLDIDVRPLTMRQLPALDETLPCSTKRINPFLHELSVGMIAYAGLHGFSALGDRRGVYTGLALPNYTLTYLDPLAAPAENKPPSMAIFGDPGSGKAQPLDAPVLTPSGWTPMGELAVGDAVIAGDGTATEVLAVYDQGLRPVWRVTLSDGATVEADAEHLWSVTGVDGPELRTTEELLGDGLYHRDGTLRWTLPLVGPVAHPEAALDEDPYTLGRRVAHASTSPRTAPPSVTGNGARTSRGASHTVALVTAAPATRPSSSDPDVPHAYRYAAPAQRLAVLQGILDEAGGILPGGELRIATAERRFAAVVVELAESLGGSATRHDGTGGYVVTVRMPLGSVVFRDPDKQRRWTAGERAEPRRAIVAIASVGVKPTRCIRVAHPSHLYVTARHIVTHNTFLAQSIAYQSTLLGLPVIFINPKGHDTLAPLAQLAGGRVVSMSRMEQEGGAFDPFRYAQTPELAAEILSTHILSVLTGFTEQQELDLSYGLRQAAMAGARCAAEALRGVKDADIVRLVVQQVRTSPLFAIGFGIQPQARFDVDQRLTLIEFDRKLDLPDPGKEAATHTRAERIALAAIRLVTRASIEILAAARGGVMIVDEAWTFLSHPSGLAALQQLGREGRSLNVFPVFCTQRIADLLGSDMESYLSRVFVMSLREEREATAALKLCGLDATPSRLEWLRTAGPQPGQGGTPARWAMALHRDLRDRHAAVLVGPVPEYARQAFTTNPAEREEIRRRLEASRPRPDLIPPT